MKRPRSMDVLIIPPSRNNIIEFESRRTKSNSESNLTESEPNPNRTRIEPDQRCTSTHLLTRNIIRIRVRLFRPQIRVRSDQFGFESDYFNSGLVWFNSNSGIVSNFQSDPVSRSDSVWFGSSESDNEFGISIQYEIRNYCLPTAFYTNHNCCKNFLMYYQQSRICFSLFTVLLIVY